MFLFPLPDEELPKCSMSEVTVAPSTLQQPSKYTFILGHGDLKFGLSNIW